MAIAVLGLSFLLRGVGDSGGSHGLTWLTWLSPIGWAELVRPFAAERWWVLGLPVLAAVAGLVAAFALAARRDQDAGLMQPRPGSARAGRLLSGPAGLSWRLQRGSVAGWTAGFLAGGLAIGVVTTSIGKLIGTSAAVTKAIDRIGGQAALTNAYLAACMSLIGLVAAAYAVSAVARLRSDEVAGRAEPLLAAAVSRWRWGGSNLVIVTVGTVVVLVAGGLGVGLAFGIAGSDVSTQVPRLIGAALAQLPAALAVAAIGATFAGLVPKWSGPVGWAALAVCGFIGVFGPGAELVAGGAGHLAVHARAEAAWRGLQHRAAGLAERGRRGTGRGWPARAAPPRHRLRAVLASRHSASRPWSGARRWTRRSVTGGWSCARPASGRTERSSWPGFPRASP